MCSMSVAIGGGKGGTGKSLIAVQLGILIAELGLRVVLVDADLNGANLHTFFGLEDPQYSLGHVLSGEQEARDVVLPTGVQELGLIAGLYQDLRDLSDASQAERFSVSLGALDADITLWDVGSGAGAWQTRLFDQADVGILVSSPSFQGMERDYFFLRRLCLWKMQGSLTSAPPSQGWLPMPWLTALRAQDPSRAHALRRALRKKPVYCLVNGISQIADSHLEREIAPVIRRFFGLQTVPLGSLEYDERLSITSASRRPFVFEFPDSRWVQQMRGVTEHLLGLLSADDDPSLPPDSQPPNSSG